MPPVTAPVAVGVNVASMVQVPFPGTISPQVSVAPKPVTGEIVIGWGAAPWLVTVNVLAALVCPIATEPSARDDGEIESGTMPVPVNVTGIVPRL